MTFSNVRSFVSKL